MRINSVIRVIPLIFLVTGCASATLSQLQSEFNSMVVAKNQCSEAGQNINGQAGANTNVESRTADYLACTNGGFQLVFLDIAERTNKTISEYTGNPKIEIALHRLHAVSLWQSGATEKQVVFAARPGIEKCKTTKQNQVPRDCALLSMVDNFVIADSFRDEIMQMEKQLTDQAQVQLICQERAFVWDESLDKFMKQAYRPMDKEIKDFNSNNSTPTSVKDYLNFQLSLVKAQVDRYYAVGSQCVPDLNVKSSIAKCDCKNSDCDVLSNNVAYKFFHRANCSAKEIKIEMN